jgi:hypothetical protein
MSVIKNILLVILIGLLFKSAKTNPIVIHFINELKIDSSGWQLEITTAPWGGSRNLDNCYLKTMTDSAYFKDSLSIDGTYKVFNNSHMKKDLIINPTGDVIGLFNSEGGGIDGFYFGDVEDSRIIAPKSYQSVCKREVFGYTQQVYHYLDNTPTLGSENDSLNAMGVVFGIVLDLDNNPIKQLELVYDWIGPVRDYLAVTTDEKGVFFYKDYAIKKDFHLKNYQTIAYEQILPEDTIDVIIRIDRTVADIGSGSTINRPENYLLNQNYPNPFNAATKILYYLPQNETIELNVYDLNGRFISMLYKGYQSRGGHVITWNPGSLASGTYIYHLKTPAQSLSKKCIFVK